MAGLAFLICAAKVASAGVAIAIVVAVSRGRRGKQLWCVFLKASVVALAVAYLAQLACIFPRVIESKELSSEDGAHAVTLELQGGGFTGISFLPVLGALDIGARAVFIKTGKGRYMMASGDSLDSFYLDDYSLAIKGNLIRVSDGVTSFECRTSECKVR